MFIEDDVHHQYLNRAEKSFQGEGSAAELAEPARQAALRHLGIQK
ncbi:MAG TPA: hypothetical protein VF503_24155 [Sphingobium sp.]